MMEYKTTTKAIKNNNYRILSCGYCALQYLLYYDNRQAYTCGVYGWNYDLYYIDNIAVCTGYRGMPASANVKKDYDIIRKYDNEAQKIVYDNTLSYDVRRQKVKELQDQFIKEITLP